MSNLDQIIKRQREGIKTEGDSYKVIILGKGGRNEKRQSKKNTSSSKVKG